MRAMDITSLVMNCGKTRAEICDEVGMSPAYLSLIESGQRKIGEKHVKKFALRLGVEIRDLRPDWFEDETVPVSKRLMAGSRDGE